MMGHVWRGAADLVVEPDVAGFAYDDFKRTGDLIRSGEVAMREALPEVRRWMEVPEESASSSDLLPTVPRSAAMPGD
jgi:hypothetical protein